jgi:hypothetical protein
LLRDGAPIELDQISPFEIAIKIGKPGTHFEIIAPMADQVAGEGFLFFICPSFVKKSGPVSWNLQYLNLERLPLLGVKKTGRMQWLVPHASLQLSARERELRDRAMATNFEVHKDVRISFKDSLFSLFIHFNGLQGGKSHVFVINNPARGGVHLIIFCFLPGLDMADHTVMLDSAVLPWTDCLMPKLKPFLAALSAMYGFCAINVGDDELRLWKDVLFTLVERCRQ